MPSRDTLDHIVVKPKRFQCPRCQRRFARLEHLQRHERTHTQERPFLCSQCDSRFTRSDLLIRHTRLSHNRNGGKSQTEQAPASTSNIEQPSQPHGITRHPGTPSEGSNDSQHHGAPVRSPTVPSSTLPSQENAIGSPTAGFHNHTLFINQLPSGQTPVSQDDQPSHATPSLAAEPTCFQEALAASSVHNEAPTAFSGESFVGDPAQIGSMSQTLDMVDPRLASMFSDTNESFDGFAAFLEAGPLSPPDFTSLVTNNQHDPPPFMFDAFPDSVNADGSINETSHSNFSNAQGTRNELNSISRLGSRLPSVQPEEGTPEFQNTYNHHQAEIQPQREHRKRLSHVSHEDRQYLLLMISEFDTVLSHFQLPTGLSLARYIRAYIDGFHEHLPFLHIPSMSIQDCSVELILAIAAVGAQYCFEAERGVELFHAARAIATERIRRRDARMASDQRGYEVDLSASSTRSTSDSPIILDRAGSSHSHTMNGPLGLPSNPESSTPSTAPEESLMQSAQALLILMAMATWANHREILREALAIQSILASIVRDDGLCSQCVHDEHGSWEEWIHCETILRTKYIVFCFFNLHSIVYDIPPLILGSEVKMRLPCSAAEFKAETPQEWQGAKLKANKPSQFQEALRRLFSSGDEDVAERHSSLGNYILIHAIIQQVLLVRQTARCRFNSSELTDEDVATLEHALRNWQLGWERNPESSLDPSDPNGPVAFNSTALLSLAYIRLNMDTGPGRALSTRDPFQIANALRDAPTIKGTPRLVRALLHSAHALSIPVKIGIRLVAKTQTFIWSIQHSLCSLECALLLSKWLAAVSAQPLNANPCISDDERRVLSIVKTILDETEFSIPPEKTLDLQETAKYLNVGVLRVWATIFKGAQTWAIVDVIGSSLNIYADMLEATYCY